MNEWIELEHIFKIVNNKVNMINSGTRNNKKIANIKTIQMEL